MYQSAFSANRLKTFTHYKGINLSIINYYTICLILFVCLYIVKRNTLLNTLFLCYIEGADIIEGVHSLLFPISYILSTRYCQAYDYEIVSKPTIVNCKIEK
jgi:hypothetical protein